MCSLIDVPIKCQNDYQRLQQRHTELMKKLSDSNVVVQKKRINWTCSGIANIVIA